MVTLGEQLEAKSAGKQFADFLPTNFGRDPEQTSYFLLPKEYKFIKKALTSETPNATSSAELAH